MPSWPVSARGKPSRSASAIVVDSARGYHDLRIDGATFAAGEHAPVGHLLKSSPFTVGGRCWHIKYYPNGDNAESAGHVSVFLALDEDVDREATALFRFTLVAEKRGHVLSFLKKNKKKVASSTMVGRSFGGNTRSDWGYSTFAKRDDMSKLVDPFICFRIRCQLVVLNGYHTEEKGAPMNPPTSIVVPPPDLHRHLGELLSTKNHAGVVFDVGGETFSAHRLVLAARSPVLEAELFSEMEESDAAAVVRIDDMEPRAFQAFLTFVYTDSLPEMKREEEDAMYQHLLVAADRYGMERLKLLCEENLCNYITVHTAATILTLAEQHNCGGLKKACLDFVSDPANLKAVVASDAFEHLSKSCPSVNNKLILMLAS
ncbi:hypothetical protein PR202_gb08037 [Eleusine coracana subsp. coracana]|uniref:Uncharacterized protein n=1 Tax=Eleusine coracana subsp. coracana TaxID=191504 RepID=A0AAV5EDN9_ELECO|nr:hypothetical protein QOZ80_2BG0180340 [Eleusine coracana subsp. coracana]GJN20637.1 hypothetical protein PR202_gb08037 [Eleusine coracana subsp. coracana]